MLNEQRSRSRRTRNNLDEDDDIIINDGHGAGDESLTMMRDIHALTPPPSSSLSSGENFTTISREFNALVLAGSRIRTDQNQSGTGPARIGGDRNSPDLETNPLAIVLDHNPLHNEAAVSGGGGGEGEVTVQRVKREEAETKINAWQNAKIAKINNRFKREEAIINGWEDKQNHKASSWMKHVERKIDEQRAKAMEKMQNDIAKARRKAQDRKASAEGKRGIKIARVFEIANFMRLMGRPPSKRSFF